MDIQDALAEFVFDPLGYVYFNWDWNKGLLTGFDGPDKWQADMLNTLGGKLQTSDRAVQIAVASGHGIGKTALISWLIKWFMSTRPNPQIVCTANTSTQLNTKTWRELSKWHEQGVDKDIFKWTATSYYNRSMEGTWRANAVPWSKERSEAFAGTHEQHVMVLYDEASLIDDSIWEVTDGAMTTPGAVWVAFGNPTRNTGRFYECFHRWRDRWITKQIDSRTCKMAEKEKLQQWVDDYGEDSDFVRVRVKGQFPRASSMQFIGNDLVDEARGKALHRKSYDHAPKVIGVDVARFGDNQSVIVKRQGLAVTGLKKLREVDTMTLSSVIANESNQWSPDAIFIDEGAMGAGVIDRLKQLKFDNVIPVNFGSKANEPQKYANKRSEIWAKMRDWLTGGAAIPDDQELCDDLVGPEYGFDKSERLQLERKKDMVARGLASPDNGDALAVTFAAPVALPKDKKHQSGARKRKKPYSIFRSLGNVRNIRR